MCVYDPCDSTCQMMANFISSILWSLGVTCILVVPGFVEGGENIALNHLSYGMSKVMINEDGFYTTENYKTANASKLHTVSSLSAC